MPPQRKLSLFGELNKYLSIGLILPSSVLAGYIVGYFLDRWLGTTYLYIVFLLLGIGGGFYKLIQEVNKTSAPAPNDEQPK